MENHLGKYSNKHSDKHSGNLSENHSDDLQIAYRHSLQLLQRREYSQHELRYKLKQQGIAVTIIEDCLQQLVADNYQSDERFAEMLTRTRVQQRQGRQKIRHELSQKGIDAEMINSQLACYTEDFFRNACYLIERKAPQGDSQRLTNDRKSCDKITRFLVGRGYDYETIRLAFESLQANCEA